MTLTKKTNGTNYTTSTHKMEQYNHVVDSLFSTTTDPPTLDSHLSPAASLFITSSKQGNYQKLHSLLQAECRVTPDVRDDTGRTALHWSVVRNHTDCVDLLLKHGADVTLRDAENHTVIELTPHASMKEKILMAVKNGGNHRNLIQASWQGDLGVCEEIILRSGNNKGCLVDVNCTNNDGFSPLLLCVRDLHLFDSITGSGGNGMTNASSSNGSSSSNNIINGGGKKHQHLQVLKLLLKNKADRRLSDPQGRLVIHLLCQSRSVLSYDILKYYLSLSTTNSTTTVPLSLSSNTDEDNNDNHQKTTNHNTNTNNTNTNIIDIHETDNKSFQAIHYASSMGNLQTLRLLLQPNYNSSTSIARANPNARAYAGLTPLHLCARNGHEEAAKLLLENGADITCVDDRGDTPCGVAKSSRIRKVLRRAWQRATEVRTVGGGGKDSKDGKDTDGNLGNENSNRNNCSGGGMKVLNLYKNSDMIRSSLEESGVPFIRGGCSPRKQLVRRSLSRHELEPLYPLEVERCCSKLSVITIDEDFPKLKKHVVLDSIIKKDKFAEISSKETSPRDHTTTTPLHRSDSVLSSCDCTAFFQIEKSRLVRQSSKPSVLLNISTSSSNDSDIIDQQQQQQQQQGTYNNNNNNNNTNKLPAVNTIQAIATRKGGQMQDKIVKELKEYGGRIGLIKEESNCSGGGTVLPNVENVNNSSNNNNTSPKLERNNSKLLPIPYKQPASPVMNGKNGGENNNNNNHNNNNNNGKFAVKLNGITKPNNNNVLFNKKELKVNNNNNNNNNNNKKNVNGTNKDLKANNVVKVTSQINNNTNNNNNSRPTTSNACINYEKNQQPEQQDQQQQQHICPVITDAFEDIKEIQKSTSTITNIVQTTPILKSNKESKKYLKKSQLKSNNNNNNYNNNNNSKKSNKPTSANKKNKLETTSTKRVKSANKKKKNKNGGGKSAKLVEKEYTNIPFEDILPVEFNWSLDEEDENEEEEEKRSIVNGVELEMEMYNDDSGCGGAISNNLEVNVNDINEGFEESTDIENDDEDDDDDDFDDSVSTNLDAETVHNEVIFTEIHQDKNSSIVQNNLDTEIEKTLVDLLRTAVIPPYKPSGMIDKKEDDYLSNKSKSYMCSSPIDLDDATITSQLGRRVSIQTTDSEILSERHEEIQWKKGNLLGQGSYGKVYCGLTDYGELIAVKQFNLDTMDRKEAETQYDKIHEELSILKTLKHRNIVEYIGASFDNGTSTVSIFMQYIPGGTLSNILKRFGALSEQIACNYTHQILTGLRYLHSNQVIHRDIKGANIMLAQNAVIKLIDFGCAKRLLMKDGGSNSISISHSGRNLSMKGTPYWMAPEVIQERKLDKSSSTKSDIWSLGCTIWEMGTRKPPWSEMPVSAAIFAIGKNVNDVPVLPCYSNVAKRFVQDCLIREVSKRPSALELLEHEFFKNVAYKKKKS